MQLDFGLVFHENVENIVENSWNFAKSAHVFCYLIGIKLHRF